MKVRVPWFHIFLSGSPHDWRYFSEPQTSALLAYDKQVRCCLAFTLMAPVCSTVKQGKFFFYLNSVF